MTCLFVLNTGQTLYAAPREQTGPAEQLKTAPVEFFEDQTRTATLAEVQARRDRFAPLGTTIPMFGVTKSAYWLYIALPAQTSATNTYYLDVQNPALDYITLYVISNGQLLETVEAGDKIPARRHPYQATTHVLPFQQPGSQPLELYLRIDSNGEPLFAPFTIVNETTVERAVLWHWMLYSLISGVFLTLFIHNLLILLLLKERIYLYYILELPFYYLSVMGLSGFGPAYLYPDNTWLANNGSGAILGIAVLLFALFTRDFLRTWEFRKIDISLKLVCVAALIVFLMSLIVPTDVTYAIIRYQFAMAVLLAAPLIYLFAAIHVWRQGRIEARFYFIGYLVPWISIITFGLSQSGIVPYHPLVAQSIPISFTSQVLFLSLALADRIRVIQRAQRAAEEQARHNLEIRGEELERLVTERTAEIRTLQGILPICANCKKIRDDQGAWQQLEAYISQNTDAEFSHGICNDCIQELYPELYRKRQQRTNLPSS